MGPIDYARSLLVTDLYQLNMVETYLTEGVDAPAVFELFVRKLPPERAFLMAAGLEQAVTFLTEARVSAEEIASLRAMGRFSDTLIDYLADFRFSGDVDAPPEGTILFPDEPLIRVTAPAPQAQLVETRLINLLHFQTLVASKAARMRIAAPAGQLVDFGLRRAHSGESGVLAARAAYVAGFDGTASVPAGQAFGIPLYGTMAHSFIQTHATEEAAFLAFARARPEETIFLLDTYDTARATDTLERIAPILAKEGIAVKGVRIDSGDLAAETRRLRARLDAAGLTAAKIMVSGGLDERRLAALAGAPIDGFGVGTSLVTSEDRPALEIAYKLKSYAGAPQRKLSDQKSYWPGPTQAWRGYDAAGRMAGDRLTPADDDSPAAEGFRPLLGPVLRGGARVAPAPSLDETRARARDSLAALPEALRALTDAPAYPVAPSPALAALAADADRARGL